MKNKDLEWIAYCQKIRIEERNQALDEVKKLFDTKLLPIDPTPLNIYEIVQAVSEIYSSLTNLKKEEIQ